ncbi:molybdenum cofactor biosynthesis protein B [Halobacteriales archaeon SW_7_65_23]|nr:MAG: molybdenum cofactor biosynthesis protein B [Halobacteriales archaeon SW_7_65_23]
MPPHDTQDDHSRHEQHDEQNHDHDSGHSHDHDHSHDDKSSHPHHEVETVTFGVVTVSTSRTLEDDKSGDALEALIESDGHTVGRRELVGDDRDGITATVAALVGADGIEAVVLTGGTGLSPEDVTVEAVRPLTDQEIPGFGELFRMLSYDDIGPRALLSRAFAGSCDGVPVFCLPGSTQGATFGTEELILPTIGHVLGHTQERNCPEQ